MNSSEAGTAGGSGPGPGEGGGVPSASAAVLLLVGVVVLFLLGGGAVAHLFGDVGLVVAQILFLLVPALVLVRAGGFDASRTLALGRPSGSQVAFGAILMAGGLGGAWLLAWAQSVVIPVPVEQLEAMERFLTAESVSRFLWLLLAVALTPAVAEEVLFRGVVLQGIRTRLPDGWAILVVGLIFGLFHMDPESAFRVLPTALLGVLLAWVVVVTGSLPLAVILHFLNNAAIVSLLAVPATREALGRMDQEPPLLVLPLAPVLLAVGAVGLHRVSRGRIPREGAAV